MNKLELAEAIISSAAWNGSKNVKWLASHPKKELEELLEESYNALSDMDMWY